MNTNKRIIRTKLEAQQSLKKGVDTLADIVKSTLGPSGRNVIIGVRGGTPVITNDGVSIAKEIFLKDEIEDLGARTLREVALQTNAEVGDGTTTAITLAQAVVDIGFKKISPAEKVLGSIGGANPILVKKQIDEECKDICAKLDDMKRDIVDKDDLFKASLVSAEHKEIATAVTEALWAVGKDGFVSFEEGYGSLISHEIIDGMRLETGYAAQFMAGSEFRDVFILVTDHVIQNISEPNNWLEKLCGDIARQGKKSLVIVAQTFSDEALGLFYYNSIQQNAFTILGIRAPWQYQKEVLEDLAAYTGAKFVDSSLRELKDVSIADCGIADKVVAKADETAFVGGKGVAEDMKAILEGRLAEEGDASTKKRWKDRIARLSGKIGVVRVGAESITERKYLMDKVEDTINATRAAWKDGVVPGAGLALLMIANDLPETSILKEAIKAPHNQIKENAGGEIFPDESIIDPVRVTKTALQKACSVAGTLITSGAAINLEFKKDDKDSEN